MRSLRSTLHLPTVLRLVVLLFTLTAVSAAAQMPVPPALPQTIMVVGEGMASVAPDRAIVRLGVVTRAATAAEALRAHEQDMARVLTRVREFEIGDRAIQIEGLSLGENYGPNGPDGFMATRVVAVTTDNLRIVPDLVASVVGEGANRLDGLFYTVRDAQPATLAALDAAMANARSKAERIAAAAGVTLGRVVGVQEQAAGYRPPVPMAFNGARAEAAAVPAAYSSGSTEVVTTLVVQFEITARR